METFPSWLLTTTLVSLVFCIFVYALRSKNKGKLPPRPPQLPIIGNLHQLLGKRRHAALWELSKKYGPVMQIRIGSKPFLIISSSTVAKQILKTQDTIFCSRPKNYASKVITYNFMDVAFSPQSDRRRDMRKLLVTELLGPKKAKMLTRVVGKEVDKMVDSLSLLPSNTEVNISNILLATMSGVICGAGFGIEYREEPIKGASWPGMLEDSMVVLGGSFVDSFPLVGRFVDRLTGWNGRLMKCFNDLDAYIEMVVNERSRNINTGKSDQDKDFLHSILELSSLHNPSDYHQLTRDEVKAHVMDVLIGGIDSSVAAAVWVMSEVARDTRVMKKLQNEIRTSMGRKEKAHELDVTQMTYLKNVVKESLRLHPPAPLLVPHESLSHTQLEGYDVFPGTTVLINVWGIGRDPKVWGENADEFYPERFDNMNVEIGDFNFEVIPFGGGRRACPAQKTALNTVETVIANLVYWFDWEPVGGLKNEDLDMEEEATLIARRKYPLNLVLNNRT